MPGKPPRRDNLGLPPPPRERVVARLGPPVRRDENGLGPDERRFAQQYLIDLNVEDAAERAGLNRGAGRYLLKQPIVQDEIARERNARIGRTRVYADEVLSRWWMLATADPREIVSLRRVCCRHCYGIDHGYQFTRDELARASREHRREMLLLPHDRRVPFDDLGGDGYDARKPPNRDCTECFGEGQLTYYLEDSDNYSPAAALLFDGIKVGRDGSIEVKLRDRGEAMVKVAQFLGLLVQRHAVTVVDPTRLSNDQLLEAIRRFETVVDGSGERIPAPLTSEGTVSLPNGGLVAERVVRAPEGDGDGPGDDDPSLVG